MTEPFAELPDALVRDLLGAALDVAERVRTGLGSLQEGRAGLRQAAESAGLIKRQADLDVVRDPTVAGVDGSYQVHRLTAVDLFACAAVAVEGTAKEDRRIWPEPHHLMWVDSQPHSRNPTNALRGLMISMEVEIAEQAPHDLVLLDGSFSALLIYMNQGLGSENYAPPALWNAFIERWESQSTLECFIKLLSSDRTVALPKYSGRNELARALNNYRLPATDARSLATLILKPGEYLGPLPIYNFEGEEREYHLPLRWCPAATQAEINALFDAMRVVFYRPFGWAPAVRIELPKPIAISSTRLATVLSGIRGQMFTPAVVEPYPLFLADRMVKSLGAGVQVVEQTVSQHVVGELPDAETTMLFLQNYRTEGGRGS